MIVNYFYRKKNIFYSIERVFENITSVFNKEIKTKNIYVLYDKVTFSNIIKNILFCNKNKGEINHITGDIYYGILGLPSRNTILTFHDLGIVTNNIGIKQKILWFIWYYLPVKKAKYITCISNFTKEELIKHTKCSPNKITVIHNPISKEFIYTPKTFNNEKPVILHIGTRVNKNLERVIVALNLINCHLRIIGDLTKEQLNLLETHKIDFSNVSNISNKEIIDEYILSDIISFPSLYEGFGMPIIESQAIGRVVLTSSIEPLVEISNDGAYLVDPLNDKSIRKGFLELIYNNELRENLIQKGLENVTNYLPEKISKEYIVLYQSIATQK